MNIYYAVMHEKDLKKFTHWYLIDFGFDFVLEYSDDNVPGRESYEERYKSIEEYKAMWNSDKYPDYCLVHLELVYSDDQVD